MLSRKVWSTKDGELPLVMEDSSWRFIRDYKCFSASNGVFVFASSAHALKYVGHTRGKCIVDTIALAIENGKNVNATMVKVLATANDEDAEVLRKVIAEKYEPENNIKTKADSRVDSNGF